LLILAFNPGHDGAVAVVKDRELLFSLESEKDSFPRHNTLTPMTLLSLADRIGDIPDVIAMGGWYKQGRPETSMVGAGYHGAHALQDRLIDFGHKRIRLFSSSHVRSHILMSPGMAAPDDSPLRAVLVWEGSEGSFYVLDRRWEIVREIPVLPFPGVRYGFLYGLADPGHDDYAIVPHLSASGKLMALAAYGDAADADDGIKDTVDRLLDPQLRLIPSLKQQLADSPLYNIGVEAEATKIAAALLTDRMFEIFSRVAQELIPAGIPLYISGGCGLNCDWNAAWRDLDHFSSVFVPPCTNDSGSALGTAIDALATITGEPYIDWSVYCGLEFEHDIEPVGFKWEKLRLDYGAIADALANGRVFAWVQDRWEMGPRALGNRSLIAEPFNPLTHDRLNQIKQREDYRPIAPCCRLEDTGKLFDRDFPDPYMLYFRRVTSPDLGAVTHVDGSARVQTVTPDDNEPLHDLLSAFAERSGVGVLCNTSLNFKGLGFINTMSDLTEYCEQTAIDDFVVGDSWFRRVEGQRMGVAPADIEHVVTT
jgi:hydroxymethyl cephem carbamoyltransferase